MRLINRPCTILRRSDTTDDEYGDPTTANTSESTVCELQLYSKLRATGGETGLDQAGEDEGRVFFLGSVTPPSNLDAVIVDGATYEFTGPLAAVRNPRNGQISHLQGNVKRVR